MRAAGSRSSRLASRRRHASQTPAQFLLESGRGGGAAAGQRADHQPIGLAELAQQCSGDVPQPASHPVAFDGGPDGLADHQSDAGRASFVTVFASVKVHDEIGLCQTNPVLHRRVKVN
jgi:hypothetical protein